MMGTERAGIRWGTTEIPYLIRRSARRGTVSVAVDPSGEVVLTAPASVSVDRLDRVVRQKARWIVERVRRGEGLARPAPREFVSGEPVLYLGRHHRLRVLEAPRAAPARLERGWLVVTVERGLPPAERAAAVRSGMIAWYRAHAETQLREGTDRWAQRLRVCPVGVLLRDPDRRWGSCNSAGVVRFSWRIVQASPRLVDYVVAHEVTHLRHEHHTSAFWAALGRVMPDYEARRADLKKVGALLVW
jgi:predicted metal-dependent hydrolase